MSLTYGNLDFQCKDSESHQKYIVIENILIDSKNKLWLHTSVKLCSVVMIIDWSHCCWLKKNMQLEKYLRSYTAKLCAFQLCCFNSSVTAKHIFIENSISGIIKLNSIIGYMTYGMKRM